MDRFRIRGAEPEEVDALTKLHIRCFAKPVVSRLASEASKP